MLVEEAALSPARRMVWKQTEDSVYYDEVTPNVDLFHLHAV